MTDADNLCAIANSSAKLIVECWTLQSDHSEILNTFWSLRDTMARLVSKATDEPGRVLRNLNANYPTLRTDIEKAMQTARHRGLVRIAAVNESCIAIRVLLSDLNGLIENGQDSDSQPNQLFLM